MKGVRSLILLGLLWVAEPLLEPVPAHASPDLDAGRASSLVKQAEKLQAAGQYAEASRLYEQIVPWLEVNAGPEHPDTATGLNNLAGLYSAQRQYAKAETLYQRALEIREKVLGPEHLATAASLNKLALLYFEQALYSKAGPLFDRALSMVAKIAGPEHPFTAISLNNLAELYNAQGEYAKAEPLYQRALGIREKALGPEHVETAGSLNNLAILYFSQGLYSKADPLYQRALTIQEKALGSDNPEIAITLNNLAALYGSQGLFTKAETLHLRVLKVREKALGPEHPDTATTLNNLAALYYSQDQYAKAEPLLKRALAIREKALGSEHPETTSSLNNLAEVYRAQDQYAKIEPLYQRALALNEKRLGPEHPDTAINLGNLAFYYHGLGFFAKAEPLYQRALAIEKKVLGLEHPQTAKSLNNLAILYAFQGQNLKSEELAHLGLSIQVTLIQREAPFLPVAERQSFIHSFGHAHEGFMTSALRGGSGAELALFSRLNRHGLLQEIEQRQAQLASLPGPQQALAAELRGLTQQLAALTLSSEQRQQLSGRQQELERQLYRLLPQLRPRIVEVLQVAAALPAGSALIEFQRYRPLDGTKPAKQRWGQARYLALVLKPNGVVTSVDLGLASPIDARIQTALQATEQVQERAPQLWSELGNVLLEPLAPAIRGVHTLFLSPDGQLNRVPFAALPAPGSGQLLADAFQLRLLTTGRELLDLQTRASSPATQPLVLANPSFDQQQRDTPNRAAPQRRAPDLARLHWSPLPGTISEGKAVAALTGARLLTQSEATAVAVQQQQAPRILHIASHAFYLEDQPASDAAEGALNRGGLGVQPLSSGQRPAPARSAIGGDPLLRSGIALAGANTSQASASDDGYLTALEVARLNWKGTELVVISACESGKGEIQAGEGVYGLKRAIAVAGARSSLLSLWKVDDLATAAFMESLYSRLMAGAGRADALAATQREFRRHATTEWRHPYVWAAFQLSGDWGRLGPAPGSD
jgi:CHAT domain-containing protein/tetratricopeptide (TPR) repeat protein